MGFSVLFGKKKNEVARPQPRRPASPRAAPAAPAASTAPPPDPDVPVWWLPSGGVAPAPQPAVELDPAEQAVAVEIEKALEDPQVELPALPQIGQRVLMMLRDENADFREVADLVSQDQVLAADVLRVVNSPAYRGVNEIRRLDLAFARLGSRELRAVILRSSVKMVTTYAGGEQRAFGEKLWRASLGAAVIMGHMSPRCSFAEQEAFLVGLLHDIGMVAVLKVVDDHYRATKQLVSRRLLDHLCSEWHEAIGRRLGLVWHLPEPIPDIMGNHHAAPPPTHPHRSYRWLIQFADLACAILEGTTPPPADFFAVPCVAALGIEDDAGTRTLLGSIPDLIDARIESL